MDVGLTVRYREFTVQSDHSRWGFEIVLPWLILLFVGLPFLELALLLEVANRIDVGPTLALVIVTGVLGATLARRQGLAAWRNVNAEMAQGRVPTGQIVDALLIFVAGVLLVTPGIITDALGFSLLIPPLRAIFKKRAAEYFKTRIVIQHGPMVHEHDHDFVDVSARETHDSETRSLNR